MSLTENGDQVFLPGGCNRTQNLRFGPYTKWFGSFHGRKNRRASYNDKMVLHLFCKNKSAVSYYGSAQT